MDRECPSCSKTYHVYKEALDKGIGIICPDCFWEQNRAIDINFDSLQYRNHTKKSK